MVDCAFLSLTRIIYSNSRTYKRSWLQECSHFDCDQMKSTILQVKADAGSGTLHLHRLVEFASPRKHVRDEGRGRGRGRGVEFNRFWNAVYDETKMIP